MQSRLVAPSPLTAFALVVTLTAARPAHAQDAKTPYPSMAPIDQYMMDRNAEIALARSAAPDAISRDAEVMVLTRTGYETAVKGKNGFVCIVERSWTAGPDERDFWNPKQRGPICLNAPAARSYLPQTIRKTKAVLAARSKMVMVDDIKTAFGRKELPPPEPGAMSYMMSKQGYLNDAAGHWYPHLMFFLPLSEPSTWGSGQRGAPVIAMPDTLGHLTILLVPVSHWSDGSPGPKE